MATGNGAACGISQTLASGHYTYATTANPNFPVNYVTYWDACRFANWLANGQPNAPEGTGTTETGSYTLSFSGTILNKVTRNAGATWVVPSENEWYKAAYYNPAASNYYLFP